MRRLLRAITRNTDLKIAAFLLAAVTWYYLVTAGIEQRPFTGVAVRVVGVPPDVALLKLDNSTVDLTLKGPRRELDTLEPPQLSVVLDLSETTPIKGETQSPEIPLQPAHIRVGRDPQSAERLPPGVDLIRAEPKAVSLTLGRVKELTLDVEVATDPERPEGITLRKSARPNRVKVRGAVYLFAYLRAVRTETIRLSDLSKPLQRRVALQREVEIPVYGRVPIQVEPPEVEVTLEVAETPDETTIPGVPVRLVSAPDPVAVVYQKEQEVTLRLSGPQRVLRGIEPSSLVAQISLKDEPLPAPGGEPRSVFLEREHIRIVTGGGGSVGLPQGVGVDVRPKAIAFFLDRMATRDLPVEVDRDISPAEDYEIAQLKPSPEQASVQGPESVLKKMKSVRTELVQVAGLKESLRRNVSLVDVVNVEGLSGVRVKPLPRAVDVVITVAERRAEKTLTGLPVHLLVKPEVALSLRVEMEPRVLGPVTFVGPRSRMEHFSADDVQAFVALAITSVAELRQTTRTVDFYIRDPQVRPAPGQRIEIKLEFPPTERTPETPEKKKNP